MKIPFSNHVASIRGSTDHEQRRNRDSASLKNKLKPSSGPLWQYIASGFRLSNICSLKW